RSGDLDSIRILVTLAHFDRDPESEMPVVTPRHGDLRLECLRSEHTPDDAAVAGRDPQLPVHRHVLAARGANQRAVAALVELDHPDILAAVRHLRGLFAPLAEAEPVLMLR